MIKRHKQLLSIFSIALIIGAFGVSGIISASNKTPNNLIESDSSDVATASKPLILPNQDTSEQDDNSSGTNNNSINSGTNTSGSSSSLNKLSIDDDDDFEDEDEDEDDDFDESDDNIITQSRNNYRNHSRDDD